MERPDRNQIDKTISADFYRENGRRGGELIKARYGQAHYQRIGRLGGLKTQEIARKAKGMKEDENVNR